MRKEGKGCCLRWCAFVQSGTVSVQLHPWFGLVVLFCYPPAPHSGWGAESTSVCLRVLFSAPKLKDHSSWSSQGKAITHSCVPSAFFPTPFQNLPWSTYLCQTLSNLCWVSVQMLSFISCFWIKWVTIFLITAHVKSILRLLSDLRSDHSSICFSKVHFLYQLWLLVINVRGISIIFFCFRFPLFSENLLISD